MGGEQGTEQRVADTRMITVSTFSRQASIWRQVAPTLEQFVRWANTNLHPAGEAVNIFGPADRNPLIAEVGFRLAAAGFQPTPVPPPQLEAEARRMITGLPRGSAASESLQAFEWHQAAALSKAIRHFADAFSPAQFSPSVPGCGVVGAAVADIISGSHLIEVKTVNRPFRGSDIRQVLTYSAMYYASGTTVDKMTIYNPRLGCAFSMPLNSVAAGVSGHSQVELMQDIVHYMTGMQVSA
ncbi:hypothetical protein PSD17_63470 [Pseudonocardia sp. D17]|nr:hypothetical protein PSD17_63470 [Pseudonocardia sp. D17]